MTDVNGSRTAYVYDGDQIIAAYAIDNQTQGLILSKRFVYGPGIDEPICMINYPSGDVYYYHYDGQGNVLALSNASGQVVEAYDYDVYGAVTIYTDDGSDNIWLSGDETPASSSTCGNIYFFTGRQYDFGTGLYYYRARMYNPALGRFMQPDPIGYADSMNLYQYCGNNPINWIDPWGRNIREVGHGWFDWHRSIQVDLPGGGYKDYTYHMNDHGRGFWTQTFGQLYSNKNGHVATDGWGDGNTIREIETTPEEDQQFKQFLDSQIGNTGPYNWFYNCHDWVDQMYDAAESIYGRESDSKKDSCS